MPLLNDETILRTQSSMDSDIYVRTSELLQLDGIVLLSITKNNRFVDVEILDRYYSDVSQMIGRVTRILSKTVPLSVKFFRINLVDYQSGYPISQITVERESLRKFELMFDGPSRLWGNVQIENSPGTINQSLILSESPVTWSLYPDVDIMLFDPDFPINGSIGWEAKLAYDT